MSMLPVLKATRVTNRPVLYHSVQFGRHTRFFLTPDLNVSSVFGISGVFEKSKLAEVTEMV